MENNFQLLQEILSKLNLLQAHTGSLVITMIQIKEQLERIANAIEKEN